MSPLDFFAKKLILSELSFIILLIYIFTVKYFLYLLNKFLYFFLNLSS